MMITRLDELPWRVEIWDGAGKNPRETLAACTGATTAIPAYEAACAAFPAACIVLRQRARIVRERQSTFTVAANGRRPSPPAKR